MRNLALFPLGAAVRMDLPTDRSLPSGAGTAACTICQTLYEKKCLGQWPSVFLRHSLQRKKYSWLEIQSRIGSFREGGQHWAAVRRSVPLQCCLSAHGAFLRGMLHCAFEYAGA